MRLRDGQIVSYTYDELGRITLYNAPGSDPDITYAYDNFGRVTSESQSGHVLSYQFDAFSQLTRATSPLGNVDYQYDAIGRRTRMTYPGGFYVDCAYETAGGVREIRENGAASGVGVLARYAYNDLSQRTSLTYGNRDPLRCSVRT